MEGFQPDSNRAKIVRKLILPGLILLPWLSILTSHYIGNGSDATGFIQYDQPYYVANGRAAFERGNGFSYPNPSDSAADAPAIYFHWLPWLLGAVVSYCKVTPGTAYSALNVALLPIFGFVTWKLVTHRCTTNRRLMMVLAVWGGGVLSILGILKGIATGIPLEKAVFEFDPTEGLWFLNWGRNSVYGIEITYHCFVGATWLMVLKNRHGMALMFAALLGATHPWSGLENLLVLNAWFLLESIRNRSAHNLKLLGAAIGVICLLLGYYKVWLPLFPSHARLQENWSLNWRAEWSTVLYAYGPVAIVAFSQLLQKRWRMSRDEQFFAVATAIAFGLTIHDRILNRSIQPLHFSRGYVWMPLFLIAVPQIERLLSAISRLDSPRRRISMLFVLAMFCFDNLAFNATHCLWQYRGEEGFSLSVDDRLAIESLNREGAGKVVFCESLELGYLLPTYAPIRSWLCHKFNTPDYIARQKELRRALAYGALQPDALPAQFDVLVLKQERDTSLLQASPEWLRSPDRGQTWQIWHRQLPQNISNRHSTGISL